MDILSKENLAGLSFFFLDEHNEQKIISWFKGFFWMGI